MPPSPTFKQPRLRAANADEKRRERLGLTVRVAAWWFCAQGLLYLFMDARFAVGMNIRFSMGQEPYIRMAGLSLLCLGFFLLKALRDPGRQYLAVDVLILYLLGRVYFLLSYRLNYEPLTSLEWLDGTVDFLLGVSLTFHRTRSTQMQGAGTLLADNALGMARKTARWLFKKGPAPRATLGNLEPEDADDGGEKPIKTASKALPHLD